MVCNLLLSYNHNGFISAYLLCGNGNEDVEMQKKVLTSLLSVLTSDWLKQRKLTKLHKAVHIFTLTFQPSSM